MGHALRLVAARQDSIPLALELPERTTFDEWVEIGRRLCIGQQAVNWHIGDWWAFGDHRYGERAKAAAEGIFGREFQTLANLASVCRKFESSRRREVLSFSHYAEVAALPERDAEVLLDKAEAEHLSVRALRHEVQALKAVNDDGGKPGDMARAAPQPLHKSELVTAYEAVIELADALAQLRPLTRREMDLVSVAKEYLDEAHAERRPVPDDFDVIFVEQGRLECEAWYRASRITVNRWLVQRGKRRLIEARAAFVKHQREAHPPEKAPEPIFEDDETMVPLASRAAQFLRSSRYGGWTITKSDHGGWRVGTVVKSSEQLIIMAERQGFDRKTAMAEEQI